MRTLGPYELLAPLGAGAMGEVYRARDGRDGAEVALKVLPAALAADPGRVRRFEREAQAAARVLHPHVLRLLDFGVADGTHYLVSELLQGETLKARLAQGQPTRAELMRLALGLVDGLEALHAAGVVHRDLKPENLFVTVDGLKILDLGLARIEDAERAEGTLSENGTTPGTVLGTAGYMAPEQVRGQETDQRADVFAVGAILYELASGRRAFPGETAIDRAMAILRDDVAPLPQPPVVPGLEALIRRCLAKAPEQRYASAHQLALELRALDEGTLAPDAPVDLAPRPPRAARRGLWLAAAWVLSLGLVSWVTATWTGEGPTLRRQLAHVVAFVGDEPAVAIDLPPLQPPPGPEVGAPDEPPPEPDVGAPDEPPPGPEPDGASSALSELEARVAAEVLASLAERAADAARVHAEEARAAEQEAVRRDAERAEAVATRAAAIARREAAIAQREAAAHDVEREAARDTAAERKATRRASPVASPEPPRAVPVPPVPPVMPRPITGPEDVHVFHGEDRAGEVRCAPGGVVDVSGIANRVLVRGPCSVVTISGEDHEVDVDSSELITISGDNHLVRHGRAPSGRAPRVVQSGDGHRVIALDAR